MLGKEVFLKKTFSLKILKLITIFTIVSWNLKSNESTHLTNISNYFNNLNEFTSSFLQIQNNEISEGLIYLKKNRLRIEYLTPSNIVFVLKKNKGMYFNKELEEVQYFNPKDTIGQFFIDLFNDKNFLLNSKIITSKGHLKILKVILYEKEKLEVEIFFEKKPLQLKKLKITNSEEIITFAILNPNFNPNLSNKIFSLANPLLIKN